MRESRILNLESRMKNESEAKPAKKGVLARAAEAIGEAVGRAQSAAELRKTESLAEHLSEKATGRFDHTWSARTSGQSRPYEAAIKNRSNADWRAGLTTATQAILDGLDVMLARSRWMIRNDGYAASAQGGYRRRVVGGGITARASARHPETKQMLKDYNAAHDLLWNAWALEPRWCDVEQTKCLYEKQAVWMDELFAAGGVLLRGVYTPRSETVGLAIQELEYEQLDRGMISFKGNAVYCGIETDPYGAPVAYHVHAAAHPLEESPSKTTRLLAGECWHLFRKTRVRQRLGAPMMAAVLPAMRNLATYEMYTISKARTEAAYHGFVEEGEDSTQTTPNVLRGISGKVPVGDVESDENLLAPVEDGMFPVLRGGRKVVFPQSATPNTVYDPFVNQNLKRIAAGTGLDLPTVARWFAEGNFNTQRRASLETEAEVEAIQDLQFINGALRGVRGLWTEIAVREGKLAAPKFFTDARWRAAYLTANWQGPPKRTVDPLKDEAAWDMKYRSMRGTPQEYYNERGRDPRDVLSEWQEFLEMARDEYGLGPLIENFFEMPTANAPKTGMQPDGSGKDSDPADAAPGGNGDGRPGLSRIIRDRLIEKSLFEE